MKLLKINYILILIILFPISIFITCSKSPTGVDLDKEADTIPWNKISGKIAFRNTTNTSTFLEDLASGIFILDGNTKSVISLAESDSPTYYELAWSFDGAKMVFSDFDLDIGLWQLFELNLSTGEQQPLYASESHDRYPAWSVDGRLAYTGMWRGIMIDGEPFYYQQAANFSRPAWSPDGKYLVASLQDTTSQGALYKISLSDTTAVALLQGTDYDKYEIFYEPIYSPDGGKIAYIRTSFDEGINGEVWIMNADGSENRRLTSGYLDWFPVWSPDGNRILFERNTKQLYIINTDGSELTKVTESRLTGTYPVWIP